jgi:hypothetical protein
VIYLIYVVFFATSNSQKKSKISNNYMMHIYLISKGNVQKINRNSTKSESAQNPEWDVGDC